MNFNDYKSIPFPPMGNCKNMIDSLTKLSIHINDLFLNKDISQQSRAKAYKWLDRTRDHIKITNKTNRIKNMSLEQAIQEIQTQVYDSTKLFRRLKDENKLTTECSVEFLRQEITLAAMNIIRTYWKDTKEISVYIQDLIKLRNLNEE